MAKNQYSWSNLSAKDRVKLVAFGILALAVLLSRSSELIGLFVFGVFIWLCVGEAGAKRGWWK